MNYKRLWSLAMSIALSVLMMTGCASSTKPLVGTNPPPGNAMVECQKLQPLTGKTGKDLAEKVVEIAGHYYDCADAHKTLIEWAEKHGRD